MPLSQLLRISFLLVLSGSTLAAPASPLLGPVYPSPANVSGKDSAVSKAWRNLTDILDGYVSNKTSVAGLAVGDHSFSIGAFSVHDPDAQKLFQYHHTSPSVANASLGTKHVDGDSIYRIGSVSKLFTVYLALKERGSGLWERPVADFIPEVAAAPKPSPDAVDMIDWSDVTLGALAGQMAGMPRGLPNLLTDLALSLPAAAVDPVKILGFPPLNKSDVREYPICDVNMTSACTREQYLQELLVQQPTFKPWTTPVYSNVGFDVLGLALENITGKPYAEILKAGLSDPLCLSHTSTDAPKDLSTSVIPDGDATKSFFNISIDIQTPDGGLYSSINDLSAVGVSILNSTLLSPVETRKWLKPVTHTSSLTESVGRPWEIHRFTQPVTHRVNDLYSKEGDIGVYSAYLILSPDHDAGFSVLTAGPSSTVLVNAIADLLTQTALAAFEEDAASQAHADIAGDYADKPTNSSLSLAVDPASGTGLEITHWTVRGIDVLASLLKVRSVRTVRLYPINEGSAATTGVAGTRAYRAIFTLSEFTNVASIGVFTAGLASGSWETIDAELYGAVGADEFDMEVDAAGRVTSVNVAAWRVRLGRAA